ncbi:MAG: DUF393 domain-containing protein [Planctomycetes bacterium]|nr:DUF393 domain-containing protein [Planctomycetota bacterium]
MLYDGSCGLCHRAVRFVVARDPQGERFRFAPLSGETARRRVPESARAGLPDSVVVVDAAGRILTRSEALLHVLWRLGGVWGLLAGAGRIVPRPLRDLAYDGVARVRRRLCAAPPSACPRLPPALLARFDP